MKRGLKRSNSPNNSRGFTIIEVMIVLAVSAAILVSALSLISGSQNKTLFTQGMNDIQQQITATINNVANGYYPQTANVGKCSYDGTTDVLIFASTGLARGTNGTCTFLGRVMQFTQDEEVYVHSVAGLRQTGAINKKQVANMNEAKATTVGDPQVIKLKNGIRAEKIFVTSGVTEIGAVGFFTGFASTIGTQLQSGALRSDFIPIPGSTLTTTAAAFPDLISSSAPSGFRNEYTGPPSLANPAAGITLCFKSGTTNQMGIITIGGEGKTALTTLQIKEGATC